MINKKVVKIHVTIGSDSIDASAPRRPAMSKNHLRLRILRSAFYWLGFVLGAACVWLILVGHTTLLGRFDEDRSLLLWLVGSLAVVAFMAREYFEALLSPTPQKAPAPELVYRVNAPPPPDDRDLASLPFPTQRSGDFLWQRGLDQNRNLQSDQVAALSQTMELLDEVVNRISARDRRTAVLLINDIRTRIDSVFTGDYPVERLPRRIEVLKLGS
jgi:hypothetical protein